LRELFTFHPDKADKIGEGRFDLLGITGLDFGDPIDWHLEPTSNKRTPLTHWSRINYLKREVAGDKKVTWELNRHQYFMDLGRAYWHTGDERYAKIFASHLEQWFRANPPKLGINWASSLELSFRSISWIWALHFFKNSAEIYPELLLTTLKFLYMQARHVERYLSTYFSPNTHLTGEALGLFYIGLTFPEFKDSQRWIRKATDILTRSIDRHVGPDGVYFEQSTYYHRYTADFYLHFTLLSQINSLSVPTNVQEKLIQLLDHLMYITRPDGTTPLIGDDDGGRLAPLDDSPRNDFRSTLSVAAVLFKRADYRFVAGDSTEELFWLLGSPGVHSYRELKAIEPQENSRGFLSGGYYVMRDGWSRHSNYLLVDCGPHGTLNCGHAHSDLLSFDMAAFGRTILVDPGTYTYTASEELRNLFRSSQYHNTLTLDEQSTSVPAGPFTWKKITEPKTRNWITSKRCDLFEGSHNGFGDPDSTISHSRSILFVKKDYWIIRDYVVTSGTHDYRLNLHFAPRTFPETTSPFCLRETSALQGLDIQVFAPGGEWEQETGWISECYGNRVEAPIRRFWFRASDNAEAVTFMVPKALKSDHLSISEINAIGGRSFKIARESSYDLCMITSGGYIESDHIGTDCKWAWLRMSPDGEFLQELFIQGGKELCFKGEPIIRASETINFAVLTFEQDALFMEVSGGGELSITTLGRSKVALKDKIILANSDSITFPASESLLA
jgi:hypothetical protein